MRSSRPSRLSRLSEHISFTPLLHSFYFSKFPASRARHPRTTSPTPAPPPPPSPHNSRPLPSFSVGVFMGHNLYYGLKKAAIDPSIDMGETIGTGTWLGGLAREERREEVEGATGARAARAGKVFDA